MNAFFKPPKTPLLLKVLLWTFGLFTILTNIFPILIAYLGLSFEGIKHLFLWQIFTHWLFIPQGALSFSLIFNLLFDLAIIWFAGSSIISEVGTKAFVRFLTIMTLISSATGLIFTALFNRHEIIAGPSAMIYSLLLIFAMLFSNLELRVFFMLSIKAKWLIAGLIFFKSIDFLAQQQFLGLVVFYTTLISAYLYGIIGWNLQSPFNSFNKIDKKLKNVINFFKFKSDEDGKIYDFKTGKSRQSDSKFMDEMLEKVSRSGKDSLTWKEKWRMRKISKRRSRNQNLD